jgi:hypothetical protein
MLIDPALFIPNKDFQKKPAACFACLANLGEAPIFSKHIHNFKAFPVFLLSFTVSWFKRNTYKKPFIIYILYIYIFYFGYQMVEPMAFSMAQKE